MTMDGEGDCCATRATAASESDIEESWKIHWRAFLEQQYQASCREESSRLDGLLTSEQENHGTAPNNLTGPLTGSKLLQKRLFWLLLFCISLVCTIFAIFQAYWASTASAGTAVRFTALQGGNPDALVDISGIENISVWTRCGAVKPSNESRLGATVTISFVDSVDVDRWSYTIAMPFTNAPTVWTMDVRSEGDNDFRPVTRHRTPCREWRVPLQEHEIAVVDMSFGKDARVLRTLAFTMGSVGPALTLGLSVAGRFVYARRCLLLSLAAIAVVCLTAAIEMAAEGTQASAGRWGAMTALAAGITMPLGRRAWERFVAPACVAAGIVAVSLERLGDARERAECASFSGSELPAPQGVAAAVLLAAGLVAMALSWRRRAGARARLARYTATLEGVWMQLQLEDPELLALAGTVAAERQKLPRGRLLQTYTNPPAQAASASRTMPAKTAGGAGGAGWSWAAVSLGSLASWGSFSGGGKQQGASGPREVQSLDQLYALAAGASMLLRSKVKQVAAGSEGLLPVARRSDPAHLPRFTPWTDIAPSPLLQAQVLWTPLKPETRAPYAANSAGAEGRGAGGQAVEKVVGALGGRCERLLDVCRESLVFASAKGIRRALRLLCADPDLRVLRIANALDDQAGVYLGLRGVEVKLRFDSAVARALGVEGHICELRLVHRAFASSLSSEEQTDCHSILRQLALRPPRSSWLRPRSNRVLPAPLRLSSLSSRRLSSAPGTPSAASGPHDPLPLPFDFPSPHRSPSTPSAIALNESNQPFLPNSPRQPSRVQLPSGPPSPSSSAPLPAPPPPKLSSPATIPALPVDPFATPPLDLAPVPILRCPPPRDPPHPAPAPASLTLPSSPPGSCAAPDADSEGEVKPPSPLAPPAPDAAGAPSDDAGAWSEAPELTRRASREEGRSGTSVVPLRRMQRQLSQTAAWPRERRVEGRQRTSHSGDILGLRLPGDEGGGGKESGGRPGAASLPGEMLLEQYRLRTLRQAPPELYERAPTLRESVDMCKGLSVVSTSFPIAAALRKGYMPLFFLMAACATGWERPRWPWALQRSEAASTVRLSALHLRTPKAVPSAPILEELQLKFEGCALPVEGGVEVSDDWMQYTLRLRGVQRFDEILFKTASDGASEADPVVFTVEVQEASAGSLVAEGGEAAAWREVAASRKVVERNGGVRFDREPGRVPEARGATVRVRLGAEWLAAEVNANVLAALFLAALTALWLRRRYEWARATCLAFGVALGVDQLACAVARSALGLEHALPLQYVRGVVYLGCSYWLSARESQLLEILALNGTVNFVSHLVHYTLLDRRALSPDAAAFVASSSLVPVACLVLIVVKRHRAAAAEVAISADLARYDAEWRALTASPEQREGCRRIAAILSSLHSTLHLPTSARPHQTFLKHPRAALPAAIASLNFAPARAASAPTPQDWRKRRRSSVHHAAQSDNINLKQRVRALWHTRGSFVRAHPAGLPRRVATLGLLYRQAAGVYHLAQRKLRAWCEAAPAGAMVPFRQEDGALGFAQVKGGGGEGGAAAWEEVASKLPALKGVQRASQKLMRAYAADPSRLLDVCRFALVTEGTGELADLVAAICTDEEVAVVGVKNRLREGYKARQSAGFRDVHFNLRLETEEAERLGIHTHVWELQLIVAPMCRLRSEGGHRRYVEYRDARAE